MGCASSSSAHAERGVVANCSTGVASRTALTTPVDLVQVVVAQPDTENQTTVALKFEPVKEPVLNASNSSSDFIAQSTKQKLGRSSRRGSTPKLSGIPMHTGMQRPVSSPLAQRQHVAGSPSPFFFGQAGTSVPSSLNLTELAPSAHSTPRLTSAGPRGAGVRAVRSQLGLEFSVPGSPSPFVMQPKPTTVPSTFELDRLDEVETPPPVPELLPMAIPSQMNLEMTVLNSPSSSVLDLASDAPMM
jgi:hypothetical protein